ncbi:MAG: ribonucleotide reductase, partial [Deltaproteobacteria bacterium]|nr:ribonucleotide reductase [Deltaproteobacteria bacterium]
SENGKGLVASGPVSFAKIYSTLNEVLRRGGVYKNGACVIHLDLNHPDAEEFVDATRQELPWVKKCLDVTQEWWNEASESLRAKILRNIQSGDIWLSKVKYDQPAQVTLPANDERVYGNVCLEIYLPSRGTCLLEHVNLGQCEFDGLVPAFTEAMSNLCSLHPTTGVGATGEYLAPEKDKQVGLGLLGLANFLRRQGVSYASFGQALVELQNYNQEYALEWTPAVCLAHEFATAINIAANIARAHGMARAFTIAPTASCSYNY